MSTPLVSLVDPQHADPSLGPIMAAGREQYGLVLNTWLALAHRPSILQAYVPYLRSVVGPGTVPARTKNLAAIQVALANHCRYSASHRVQAARADGVTDQELDALARGELDGFSPDERLAMVFARELSLCPPAVRQAEVATGVDPDLLRQLQEAFDQPQLVELTACISLWNALTRFHRVMGLALDMPAPPASFDAVL